MKGPRVWDFSQFWPQHSVHCCAFSSSLFRLPSAGSLHPCVRRLLSQVYSPSSVENRCWLPLRRVLAELLPVLPMPWRVSSLSLPHITPSTQRQCTIDEVGGGWVDLFCPLCCDRLALPPVWCKPQHAKASLLVLILDTDYSRTSVPAAPLGYTSQFPPSPPSFS